MSLPPFDMVRDPIRVLVLAANQSDDVHVNVLTSYFKHKRFLITYEWAPLYVYHGRLDEIMATVPFDIVIVLQGLSAHLPGFVASRTLKPVISVPLNASLGGVDAILSSVQMGPGMPVLTLPPLPRRKNEVSMYWRSLARIWLGYDRHQFLQRTVGRIHFVGPEKIQFSPEVRQSGVFELLEESNISYTWGQKGEPEACNIFVFPLARVPSRFQVPQCAFPIVVPYFDVTALKKAESALAMHRSMVRIGAQALWVNTNGFLNAVCAAMQIHNATGTYNTVLTSIRKGRYCV